MQSQLSTGSERLAAGSAEDETLGAFTLGEFCDRFRISRSMAYLERRAGRLRFQKIGVKAVITRTEARRYQSALDAAAAERATAA